MKMKTNTPHLTMLTPPTFLLSHSLNNLINFKIKKSIDFSLKKIVYICKYVFNFHKDRNNHNSLINFIHYHIQQP